MTQLKQQKLFLFELFVYKNKTSINYRRVTRFKEKNKQI